MVGTNIHSYNDGVRRWRSDGNSSSSMTIQLHHSKVEIIPDRETERKSNPESLYVSEDFIESAKKLYSANEKE